MRPACQCLDHAELINITKLRSQPLWNTYFYGLQGNQTQLPAPGSQHPCWLPNIPVEFGSLLAAPGQHPCFPGYIPVIPAPGQHPGPTSLLSLVPCWLPRAAKREPNSAARPGQPISLQLPAPGSQHSSYATALM